MADPKKQTPPPPKQQTAEPKAAADESPAEAPVAESKRPQPPVLVPRGPVRPTQFAAGGVRTLQTMLHDLGLYNRRIHGHYDNYTRNAVSELQQRLSEEMGMKIRPDGVFNQATLDALLDSSIPTTQA
jgi:peptidoglycan hydrolase-like protein with peptidoglycan-binding domain